MADDKGAQKVKLIGSLWTTRLILSIIRALVLIVFLVVAIVGIVDMASTLGSMMEGIGNSGLQGLIG